MERSLQRSFQLFVNPNRVHRSEFFVIDPAKWLRSVERIRLITEPVNLPVHSTGTVLTRWSRRNGNKDGGENEWVFAIAARHYLVSLHACFQACAGLGNRSRASKVIYPKRVISVLYVTVLFGYSARCPLVYRSCENIYKTRTMPQ